MIKGKLPTTLSNFLQENVISKEIKANILCSEKKLASSISEKLGIQCTCDEKSLEIIRGIRFQMTSLLEGISEAEMKAMNLGLSHSLSRYKLKFSAEKVDVMIIQAISLLDDLDKELNNYAMRLKEWYCWHFPELSVIITDNLLFAKIVKLIGMKNNIPNIDFKKEIPEVPDNLITEIKEASEISMGTDILPDDELYIKELADQIIEMYAYRESLSTYLKNRMQAVAPNLSSMIGEVVASRLISKAGSLINLAKLPASTIQILGAEKALFKALKTKNNTPKYGLIYHASLVGAAEPKIKGKISRSLAAKSALCIRYDALGESLDGAFGVNKAYIEAKVKQLEAESSKELAGNQGASGRQKYNPPASKQEFNPSHDIILKKKREHQQNIEGQTETQKKKFKSS